MNLEAPILTSYILVEESQRAELKYFCMGYYFTVTYQLQIANIFKIQKNRFEIVKDCRSGGSHTDLLKILKILPFESQ